MYIQCYTRSLSAKTTYRIQLVSLFWNFSCGLFWMITSPGRTLHTAIKLRRMRCRTPTPASTHACTASSAMVSGRRCAKRFRSRGRDRCGLCPCFQLKMATEERVRSTTQEATTLGPLPRWPGPVIIGRTDCSLGRHLSIT